MPHDTRLIVDLLDSDNTTPIDRLIQPLIAVTGRSQAGVAAEANVDRGNLSAWLKGKRYLGRQALDRVANALGVVGGRLRRDQVHVWRLSTRELPDLKIVLHHFTSDMAIAPLRTESLPEDSRRNWSQMSALVDADGIRALAILIDRPADLPFDADAELPSVSPAHLPGTHWMHTTDTGSPQPVMLSAKHYLAWQHGEVSVEAFKRIERADSEWAWVRIRAEAEDRGLHTQEIFNWIKTHGTKA